MSTAQKYRVSQAIFAAGFMATLICIYMLYCSVLGPGRAKFWFVATMVAVIIDIAAGLAFYYYRAHLHDSDTGQIEVQTLANSVRPENQQQASQTPENDNKTPPKASNP